MSSHPTPPERPFGTVAVLGLGAMGGSLARALSALQDAPRVVGWAPVGSERDAAANAGAVQSTPTEWREAVAGADLVVLAAPLGACCELLDGLAEATSPEATLSDVASLKAPIQRAAAEAGLLDRWVGAHPMAGTEESGFGASRADLYDGARVWTVADASAEERVPSVHALWRSIGARPEEIDAREHDRLMALASHLPQLVSNALASVLARSEIKPDDLGPGGSDMTRLAGSSPSIWHDLLEHAAPELAGGLDELAEMSKKVAHMLRCGDLDAIERLMSETREWSQGA
jgi:prephenate dehydrogenase